MARNTKTNAQALLQGKKIVEIDNGADNQLILILDDGTKVTIEGVSVYVGNGMSVPKLRIEQENN